ncbi:MAG: DUF1697 domain-containing protein [Thermoplasmata archaeon]|nr:DUF1697 domain-containing protein [Thermoplasmata archaeon]
MATYVVLLRAVNVGGHAPIAMAPLRGWLEAIGFEDVRTYLQSGNLVFSSRDGPGKGLEERLERLAEQHLHLRTEFFLRTVTEWAKLVARNPFPTVARRDPAHLVMVVLKEAPKPERVRDLQANHGGPEELRPGVRHLYVTYPDGIGRSRLTLGRIETALGVRGTARNWNTVRALAAMTR